MKKYIFLFVIVSIVTFLTACNDQLDLQNDGRINVSGIFADRYETMGYLNSCYGYCPQPKLQWPSYCDEAEDVDDNISSSYSNWYQGAVTASNFGSYSRDGSPWTSLYEGIRKCNVFLANIWGSTAFATDDEKKGWAAQAHTLRALYYLQLIKRYGEVPIYDKPVAMNYDFSKLAKSKFSAIVKFILDDCDSALKAPATAYGFPWEVYSGQFGMMNRAVPYAIKSEAITYAASPLWTDGTYSWADATKINGEALYQCLTHDYSLFNVQPKNNAAQNAYALYFFTSSNDQRSVDKETIYQCGSTMNVWSYAGLPTNSGMVEAGPCPTQELIDSYEMANGQPAILGYSDAAHLQPIINTASGYDPNNPYVNRDPRFDASIYYNGSLRVLNNSYDMSQTSNYNQITVKAPSTGVTEYITTGTDPHMNLPVLAVPVTGFTSIVLSFEYICPKGINDPQIFFGTPGVSAAKSIFPAAIPASSTWQSYSIDLTAGATNAGWGAVGNLIRFDLGGKSGIDIQIRNMKLTIIPKLIQTYTGGAEGISQTDRTHTRTGYYIRKFNNCLSTMNNPIDGAIRLFRLGELYLNFAESAYQSDGPDVGVSMGSGMTMSARDAVNAIRTRAGMPPLPSGMSAPDFQTRYRNERRVELAFEGHRFFDVRRWKILSQTDQSVSGMQITKNGGPGSYIYARFKFADRNCASDKWLMYPLDQTEVDKMMGYTGINWQNPGW